MQKLGLNALRAEFLNFFGERGHHVASSYSLVPVDDASVLLVNAGMQPLKSYFTGLATPPKTRMATCQKCFRTIDIDNVGHTSRHATMFEMLGNFSFGDYFKKETITWGWEFLTKTIGMDESLLWPSVYFDDEEAFKIWENEIGIAPERITKLGKDDNFWEIGTGPCGPCSEIYYDRGEKYGCGSEDCRPGCECDRFTEIWNHVFSEFDRQEDGSYEPLKQKNIDTGMGLERLALVVQGVDSIFEIDTIKAILDAVKKASKAKIGDDITKEEADVSEKIVTDHLKSAVFLIGDGVNPSNEGRGYVLRRVFRRAVRHGLKLQITREDFIGVIDVISEMYGEAYPELIERKLFIKKVVESEYDRFAQTLSSGMNILEKWTEDGEITGDQVFTLYDTYGFPVELTKELLDEKGISFDQSEFEERMNHQKELARKATKNVAWETEEINVETCFDGYEHFELDSVINYIDGNEFTLENTPFYPSGGGQIADTGIVTAEDGSFVLRVTSMRKNRSKTIIHEYDLVEGTTPKVGDKVHAKVDVLRRLSIMRNHTATHLVHAALRKVLGTHVTQAGSLVSYDRLRFDFTHFEPLSAETIMAVEDEVNSQIFKPLPVAVEFMTKEEADKRGALALFGEKYEEKVRVVSMEDYSVELCGGTHLPTTGEVGVFKIISESGIAAGVRRIEAITGSEVFESLRQDTLLLSKLEGMLKAKKEKIVEKTEALIDAQKTLTKENEKLKQRLLTGGATEEKVEQVGEYNLHVRELTGFDSKAIRSLGDSICSKDGAAVFVAINKGDGKNSAVVMLGAEAIVKGAKAGVIIKKVTAVLGGGGGGRDNMAEGRINDASKIDAAIDEIKSYLGGA